MFNQDSSDSFMKLWHRVWLYFIVFCLLVLLFGFVLKHKANAEPVSVLQIKKPEIVLVTTQTADIVPGAVASIVSRFGCHDPVVFNVILSAKDPVLTAAQIATESEYQRRAISKCGCRGYMQLSTELLKEGWDNPIINIRRGIAYQEEQIERFGGSKELGLAAYNAGPGAVKKYKGIPPYTETQNYVHKIFRYMKQATREVENNPSATVVYINNSKKIKGVLYHGKTQEVLWKRKRQPEFRPNSESKYQHCPAPVSDRSGNYRQSKLYYRSNC
jgi:hypothetical protein